MVKGFSLTIQTHPELADVVNHLHYDKVFIKILISSFFIDFSSFSNTTCYNFEFGNVG
jgi:hypothetical protein